MNDKRSLKEKAAAAETNLKEAIREANGLANDLRAAIKQAKGLVAELVETVIRDEFTRQLGLMSEEVSKATDQATAAVFTRFDKLEATMLGETKTRNDKGQASIPDLVERAGKIRQMEGEAP